MGWISRHRDWNNVSPARQTWAAVQTLFGLPSDSVNRKSCSHQPRNLHIEQLMWFDDAASVPRQAYPPYEKTTVCLGWILDINPESCTHWVPDDVCLWNSWFPRLIKNVRGDEPVVKIFFIFWSRLGFLLIQIKTLSFSHEGFVSGLGIPNQLPFLVTVFYTFLQCWNDGL